MKLQDLLSGYKLASGLTVFHLTYFITLLFLPSEPSCPQSDYKSALKYLYWSHLIAFFLSLLSYLATYNLYYCLAFTLDWICIVVFHAAIFYSQVIYFWKDECDKWMPIGNWWLKVEVDTYYGFIFSAIIYLILSSLFRINKIKTEDEQPQSA